MIQIKEEFKKLIPALTNEEFKQLEDNCLSEGIREKILTWNGFIIDGHNRYEIATRWDLDYETESKYFDSEIDVRIWMRNNQKGRRNLTKAWMIELELGNKEDLVLKGSKTQGKRTDLLSLNDKKLKEPKHNTQKEIAKNAGTSTGMVAMSEIVKKKNPDLWEKAKSGEVTVTTAYKEIKKEEKKEELQKKKIDYEIRVEQKTDNNFKVNIFETKETFRVIYADPAWSYNDKQDTPMLGGAAKHYDTMSISQLCELPVSQISQKDSVLFLWVTSPLLEDAFAVIKKWGFKYKTSFIWDKVKHNMGHYNSVRHEILLVCTKGSCTPDNKKLYDSVQSIERNDNHSEKPIEFLNIIDDIYTYGNKLEMFCRSIKKENWYGWGNEL